MIITGTNAADTLTGTAGSDDLNGLGGDDTLDGGAGQDLLQGGTGNNTYQFGREDGRDTIAAQLDATPYTGDTTGKLNTLAFKAGVAATDVTVARTGTNLQLSVAGGGMVLVSGFFLADDPLQAWNPLQQVLFADGLTWDLRSLVDLALTGTDSADLLTGTTQDDTLDGGKGNDALDGGLGNDTYLFGTDGGADRLIARLDSRDVTGDESGKLNTLRFKDGVTPDEVVAGRVGDSLVLRLTGSSDSVTVEQFFTGNDPYNDYNPLQRALFADGTAWPLQTLTDRALLGGSGDDTLTGTVYVDTLDGGAGRDVLDGGRGNNTYRYGAGDGADEILAFYDTTAYTGDATGRLSTLAFKEGVLPADVSGSRAGDDTLVGTLLDDTLDGRSGNDSLDGGLGNDTYLFGLGDGSDRLLSGFDPRPYTGDTTGRLNTLQLKAGVAPDDVVLTRSGIDLQITLQSQDQFTAEGFYGSSSPAGNSLNPLQQLRFSDGLTWDLATLVAHTARPLSGSLRDDLIEGTAGIDAISALSGRDTIQADAGNDAIDGGSDVDTVVYGAARAAYAVSRTAGGFKVAAQADAGATEGTDQLRHVERLRFSDGGLALDLDGHAGQVAKILGAVFGAESIGQRAYAAAGLTLLGDGMSYADLGALAMSVAGPSTPVDIVERLWANVVGTPLPDAERASYVSLLESGTSVGDLVVLAADSALNAANIDLAGLATTGLAFD